MQLLNAPVFRYSIRFHAIQHLSLPGYYAVSLSDLIIERGGTYISDFSQVTFGIP